MTNAVASYLTCAFTLGEFSICNAGIHFFLRHETILAKGILCVGFYYTRYVIFLIFKH